MNKIELENNLKVHKDNLIRLLNYNHLYSTYQFKQACEIEIRKVKQMVANIEEQLSAKSKAFK